MHDMGWHTQVLSAHLLQQFADAAIVGDAGHLQQGDARLRVPVGVVPLSWLEIVFRDYLEGTTSILYDK